MKNNTKNYNRNNLYTDKMITIIKMAVNKIILIIKISFVGHVLDN